MTMMEHQLNQIKEFYKKAPNCKNIVKEPFRWLCERTQKLCGPKICPKINTSFLFPPAPKNEQEIEGGWTPREIRVLKDNPNLTQGELHVLLPTRTKIAIARKRQTLERSRKTFKRKIPRVAGPASPHVRSGEVQRVMVTFFNKEMQRAERWGFDVVLTDSRKKPGVKTFHGKNARFYFPSKTTEEVVKSFVHAWFKSEMGSPVADFSVDIF